MFTRLLTFALLAFVASSVWAADVIDRIVATVNGHAILQSDWEDEISFESLLAGHPADQVAPLARKAALDRLIDQELLREQMPQRSEPQPASSAELQREIQDVRRQYPGAQTAQGWRAVLASFHLSEEQVEKRLATQLDVLRLVDAKLRPTVQIDEKSIESYYNQELLPQLRQAGAKQLPLEEVTPKIKEVLTQQKMNQALAAWLQNLRAGSSIRDQGYPQGQPQ
jgi:hypothetical protein